MLFSKWGVSKNHKLWTLLFYYGDDILISSQIEIWGEISGVNLDGHVYI